MSGWRAVLRGAASLSALELVGLALGLVTLPWLLRVLGPVEFGRYALGMGAASLLALVADFGFAQYGPRAVARTEPDSEARAQLLWALQAGKLVLVLASVPLLILAAYALRLHVVYSDVLWAAWAGACGSLLLPVWFLQGAQMYRSLALSQALARLLVTAAMFVLVTGVADTALAVLLQAGSGALAGVLALGSRSYRSALRWARPQQADVRAHLRAAWPLFISNAAITAYTQAVPVLLGVLVSPLTVGLFAVADRLRAALQALLAPLGAAAYPWFARRLHDDRAQGLAAVRRLMGLQVALGCAAALVLALGAEPVLRLLGGEAYVAAVPAAQVLGLCMICTAASNSLGVQVMLSLHMERAFATILVVAASSGLLAVALLAPRWLHTGAAVAVLGTEALVVVLMAVHLRRQGVL